MTGAEGSETKVWRDVLAYVGLLVVLTLPIWLLSGASAVMILPGLPLAGVAVVCPVAVALILTLRREGLAGARTLLGRIFDGGRVRPPSAWLVIALITPAVAAAAFLILRLTGSAIPDPAFSATRLASLLALFLVSALCEELGWTAFLLERLRTRCSPLIAALIIGAIWAAWHYPALVQAHRSVEWIAWWTLWTMSQRLIMVGLYEMTGRSLFSMAVFHAMNNLSWQTFPVQGSWFDPRLHGPLMALVALAVWLTYWRFSPAPPPHGRRMKPWPPG